MTTEHVTEAWGIYLFWRSNQLFKSKTSFVVGITRGDGADGVPVLPLGAEAAVGRGRPLARG